MLYDSVPASNSWRICANPLNRTGKPCYSRRCSCPNCRNKAVWREYAILVRSLQRRPASHMVTLVFPWRYTGHDVVARMNQFFKRLMKATGCPMRYYWYYDSQAKGLRPHVHALVQSEKDIQDEAVRECWRRTFPDEVVEHQDTHVRRCDANVVEAARYVTKHGEPAKQISKSVWCGRLQGGTTSFFVATKKMLFQDEVYREDYDAREYWELLQRFEAEYPHLAVGTVQDATPVDEAGDSSLSVNPTPDPVSDPFRLSWDVSIAAPTPLLALLKLARARPPPDVAVVGSRRTTGTDAMKLAVEVESTPALSPGRFATPPRRTAKTMGRGVSINVA